MKANSNKFQLLILSPTSLGTVELSFATSTCITSQGFVKVLGINIYKQLTFNEAAQQLNILEFPSCYTP